MLGEIIQRREKRMDRIFVDVECSCFADGSVRPIKVTWPDGRTWKITRTLHTSVSVDDEFEGIRYTVLIGSAEKNIYRIGSRWYVTPIHTEVDSS